MAVDYSSYKPVTGDTQYATKINNFIEAVEADMNLKLDTSALVERPIAEKTADYTTTTDDYTIEIDATVADVTITLHNATTCAGQLLLFRRVDATSYLGIIGSVYALYSQGETVTLQSNGTDWVVVGR
jgi:hypothetical protein